MTTQQELPATIQMPVRRFTNPDTGSQITYIGMLHAAQPAYYAQVATLLADLETQGATIHYERVHQPTDAELAHASDQQREDATQLKERLDADYDRMSSIGLALQRDEFVLRESWENHDISLLGAARFYGPEVLRQQREAEKQAAGLVYDGLTKPVLRAFLLQSLAACVKVAIGAADFEIIFPHVERQLATLRETIALCAVDAHLAAAPGADLALVWGAAHLPHFTESLALRGFKEDGETTWITAIDPAALPPLEN